MFLYLELHSVCGVLSFYSEAHCKICLLIQLEFLREKDLLVSLFTSFLLCTASPALTCSSTLVEREKKEETYKKSFFLLT